MLGLPSIPSMINALPGGQALGAVSNFVGAAGNKATDAAFGSGSAQNVRDHPNNAFGESKPTI
jgi:hypothetical protein